MIKLEIYRNNLGEYVGIKAYGHADRRPKGEEDALCAAVSVLTINALNSLLELADATVDYNTNDDGFLEFYITSSINDKTNLLMRSLVLGLNSIQEDRHLKIEFMEV